MIILSETTDNLQLVLAAAITTNQLDCYTTWRDVTTSLYTPGRTVIASNSTTDVNIAAAPAASTQRIIDSISVYNKDTVPATVTIKLDANGTEYILFKSLLYTQEILEYSDKEGFQVFTADGRLRVEADATVGTPTIVIGTTVVTNSDGVANTLYDATGLSFAVTNGQTYWFRFIAPYQSAATTTGSRWTINGPTVTNLNYTSTYTLTATTVTTNFATAIQIPAASSASSLVDGNVAIVEGVIKPSASGTVQLQFASEVLSSAITLLAGGRLEYQRII